MDMQTTLFETLADPSRLRIVEALGEGEHSVNDIVARMDIHQSACPATCAYSRRPASCASAPTELAATTRFATSRSRRSTRGSHGTAGCGRRGSTRSATPWRASRPRVWGPRRHLRSEPHGGRADDRYDPPPHAGIVFAGATISELARTVRSDSRPGLRSGPGGPRDRFPSRCETVVPPSSAQP